MTSEVAADRERIRSICSLPEAAGQLPGALALALNGTSVEQAQTVLRISQSALTPDEVAAAVNKKNAR